MSLHKGLISSAVCTGAKRLKFDSSVLLLIKSRSLTVFEELLQAPMTRTFDSIECPIRPCGTHFQ